MSSAAGENLDPADQARNIPSAVKRQVRQECGFGCVICGAPLYDYEHIDDFAMVKSHEPKNIALLCPTHHAMKTRKVIDRATVQMARQAAVNRRRARSGPFTLPPAGAFEVEIGTCRAWTTLPPHGADYPIIWIEGHSHLAIHSVDGLITFSMELCDQLGNSLVTVDHGEIKTTTGVWDITYEGGNLKIRAGPGTIVADMRLTNSSLNVKQGYFRRDGLGFSASAEGLDAKSGTVSICRNRNAQAGWNEGGAFAVFCDIEPPKGFAMAFRSHKPAS